MAAAPEFLIDMLNGLLEAEVNNIFRTIGRTSSSLQQAEASIRDPIDELRRLSGRHSGELAELIANRGGVPHPGGGGWPDHVNAPSLSLQFLLPKLVAEKDLILTRYENVKAQIGPEYPEIVEALTRIEGEQRHFLDLLGRSAERVTGGRYRAPPHEQPRRPAKGR